MGTVRAGGKVDGRGVSYVEVCGGGGGGGVRGAGGVGRGESRYWWT